MLTPEDLEKIESKVKIKLSFINLYVTGRVIQEMERTFKELSGASAAFTAKEMQSAAKLMEDIGSEVKEQSPKIDKEVRQAFYDAAGKINYENEQFTDKIAKQINEATGSDIKVPSVPTGDQPIKKIDDLKLTPKEKKLLESAYQRTTGEIVNLTKTMPLSGQNTYIEACNTAYTQIQGGVDPNTAIVNAIKDVSSKGITTVAYNSRNDSVEVAIARAVRTGVNQASCDISLARCNELGANFVRVSQHFGARVTPFDDYTNHSWWQGKVYHLDWKNSALSKYDTSDAERNEIDKKNRYINEVNDALTMLSEEFNKYADFVNTCGYGKIQGIAGINCRHSFAPFYPGISIQTEKPIDSAENKKRYEQDQHQRALERSIRKLKKEKAALDSASNDSQAMKDARSDVNRKLNAKAQEYDDYCKKNRLPRQNWRLSIG